MLQIKQDGQTTSSYSQYEQYVPLKRVNVEATIRSFAADVTLTQIFRNDEITPIEAVYCFPIEEQATVYAFAARIDDREIVAQLKEKKEAQQEYIDALREGHGAYLLEQDEKSQDNFIISVGALPPGQECHITISYVSELDLVENGTKIRFVVPTTIAPRYNPNIGDIGSPASTTAQYLQSTPYTIEFHCRVENVDIARISSISHPIQVDLTQQGIYVIEFVQQNTHLDRDILVDIELEKHRSNTIVAVEPGAIMASFTPTKQDCQLEMNNSDITNEFMFIVDCSGSMDSENKIGLARQAVLLFLKRLPVGCHFNIIRFGLEHKSLFNDITVIYNEDNAKKAEQLTNEMTADLGGTELLRPLQYLKEHPPARDHARQIFLLTDGEISNVDEVIDLCRSMSTSTRIFSFGLGQSSSRSLVKGLARATNGRFVFVPPNTHVDVYVNEQLQKALQPCITNVQINWHLPTPVMNVPTIIPPVYVNDRLIVYALAEDKSISFDCQATVELHTEHHHLGEANVSQVPNVSNDGTIARLAAKALILELQHSKVPSSNNNNTMGSKQTRFQEQCQEEMMILNDEKEMTKKRIVELSLKYNILSPYTAFIGIEKRVNTSNANMVLREVPIQISADDQHLLSFPSCYNQLLTSASNCHTKPPELLARYCDELLRKGTKTKEGDIEEKINEIMVIFNYVEDKYTFRKFYCKMLAKRLVGQLSVSHDYEELMISKLKQISGFEYTLKLQRMLQDIPLSTNLTDEYNKYCEKPDTVDFSVMVLTSNSWPFTAPSNFYLSPPLKHTTESFNTFYLNKFNGQKLEWLYQYSKGELQTLYTKPKYILQVSTYQMTILLLFNDFENMTVQRMLDTTQIEHELFLQVVSSLLKSKVLICLQINAKDFKESNIKLEYIIQVNEDFKSKHIRINLNQPIKSVEQQVSKTINQLIQEHQKILIQAAIIRIMKSRKQLKQTLLIPEIIEQFASRFKRQLSLIETCIELLIEKEYIERDEKDRDLLHYVQ